VLNDLADVRGKCSPWRGPRVGLLGILRPGAGGARVVFQMLHSRRSFFLSTCDSPIPRLGAGGLLCNL
jgi:hypothetical protein